MAGTAELAIVIKARDEATAVLGNIEKKSGGLTKAFGDMTKIAGGFVMGQGILQAPGFLVDAAQAAADDAASQEILRRAVENTGAAWDTYRSQLDGTIARAQEMGYTDDQARNSLSLLTAQTGSAEEAQNRFRLAMDLSRGANIDLETASRLLGKVTEENANVLARYGITVKEGTTEAELFGLVQEKFGGQAETFGKSTAGQMAAAKIQMSELKEELGYALLPVMTKGVEILTKDILPAVQKYLPKAIAAVKEAFNSARPVLQAVWTAFEDGWDVIKPAIEWVIAKKPVLIAALTAIGVAAVLAFTPITAPILIAVAAIVGLIAVVGLIKQHWDDIKAKTEEIWNAIGGFIDEKLGWLKGLFEAVWTHVSTTVEFWFESIKNYFVTWWQVVKGIFDFAVAIIKGDWSAAWEALKGIGEALWNGIQTQISTSIEAIKGLIAGVPAYLLGQVGDWANAGGQLALNFLTGMKNMFSGGVDIAGDIARIVVNAIIGLINSQVIDRVNSLLDFKIPVPLGPDIHVNPPDIPRIPTLAAGTLFWGGGPAWLAERGPELIDLPYGARVYSNSETQRMLSRTTIGRQGPTYNIFAPVHVHQARGDSLSRELDRVLR